MENILSIIIATGGVLFFTLLLIAFWGKWLVGGLSYMLYDRKEWKKEALEADAVILAIEQTGLCINCKPKVKLQVQVTPAKGRNFVTEIDDVEAAAIAGLKTGSLIKVKYNPRNNRELLLIQAA